MKKLTKRLTLFIALAILVTVGNVYAQWVYTGNSVGHTSNNLDVSMQTYENEGGTQQGYFTKKYNNLMVLVADNMKGTDEVPMGQAGDYVAEIAGHGGMVFLFQPYAQTTEAEMDALTFNIYFEETTPIVYEGVNVFKYTNAINKKLIKIEDQEDIDYLNTHYANLQLDASALGTASELGLYYYEITFAHLLADHIAFTDEFNAINNINTLEKWDKLNDAIMKGSLNVIVKDTRDVANQSN